VSSTPTIPKGYCLLGDVAYDTRTKANQHLKNIKEYWDQRNNQPPSEEMFKESKIIQRKGKYFVVDLIPESVFHENKN